MRKTLVISILLIIIAIISIIAAVIISFAVVKPTTDSINKKQIQKFAKIVRVPKEIRPQNKDFSEITYIWEMETNAGEVVPMRFRHPTGYPTNQDAIEAILELPEGNDASIFVKVLPAVISDRQALNSAQDPQHANLAANEELAYSQLKLSLKEDTGQTIRITWSFDRNFLTRDLESEYARLNKFPEPLLKTLYNFQKLTLEVLSP